MRKRKLHKLFGLTIFLYMILVIPQHTLAASKEVRALKPFASTSTAKRVALVIGNDRYQTVPPLQNAAADAHSIAAALERAGFIVTLKTDANLATMKQAAREFKNKLSGGDEAVFFYSGHGVQFGGDNYLLPVDIINDDEDQVKDDAIPLQRLLGDLRDQKVKFALAIVDACRDNPFKSNGRSIGGTRGLAPTTAANGQMIIFSAGDGQRALDKMDKNDRSKNGVFTRVFLEEMQKPGVEVGQLVRSVRGRVAAMAKSVNHDQVPALYDQVIGDFMFYPGTGTQPTISSSVVLQDDEETALWTEVQKTNSKVEYGVYLEKYPNGKYAVLANLRIKKLHNNADNEAWDIASQTGSNASYKTYLQAFPNGRFIGLAKARLKKLQNDIPAQEEAAAWKTVQTSEDSKIVQSFIDKYPGSSHLATALQKLAAIRKAEANIPNSGTVFRDCPDCPDMVVIPAGGFEMGSNNGESNEKPVHHVTIAKPFSIGQTEVTQGQWQAIMGSNPSNFDNCGNTCPVEKVSWDDAKEFIRKLNDKTGKKYHLPSEAEWEYACRAGESHKYCGSDNMDSVAWHENNSGQGLFSDGKIQPVAQKQANAFGLYDMSGNVWEWVDDDYHGDYNGAPTDGSIWKDGQPGGRVVRGGSWYYFADYLRSTYRLYVQRDFRDYRSGFRLARTLP